MTISSTSIKAGLEPSELTIVPASRKDAYTLTVLSKAFFAYANFNTDKIEKRLAKPHIRYVLAKKNGQTVGFCDYALYAKHAKLLGVAVLPENRRQGIAKALVEHALVQIRRLNKYRFVFLMADPTNTPAIELYRSLGFVKARDSRKRLFGQPLIILKKEIH